MSQIITRAQSEDYEALGEKYMLLREMYDVSCANDF